MKVVGQDDEPRQETGGGDEEDAGRKAFLRRPVHADGRQVAESRRHGEGQVECVPEVPSHGDAFRKEVVLGGLQYHVQDQGKYDRQQETAQAGIRDPFLDGNAPDQGKRGAVELGKTVEEVHVIQRHVQDTAQKGAQADQAEIPFPDAQHLRRLLCRLLPGSGFL